MAFTVAIAQPTGVGSAVGTRGLSGAWLEEPVVITMPPDQYAYEVTIEDESTDVDAELDGAATAAPTLRATGKGSVRLLIRYRATSVARWETGYRVVRFQRDADGSNLETVAPALLESPAETAEARGYAEIMDQVVEDASGAGDVAADVADLDDRVVALEPTELPTVIMFNGQSNMMAGPWPSPGFSELTALLGADILGFNQTTQTMTQVVDGGCNARANFGGYGTGPGPGLGQIGTRLARMIADETGGTVRTYALAYPGQSITYFLPASATRAYFEDGSQHGTLNNFNLLASYVAATGIVPEYYVFCQGEADAGMSPVTYRGHLDTIDAALQALWPGMKMLIIGTIGNRDDRQGAGQPSVTGVRKAQREFCEAHPDRVLFVDNTDMRGNTSYFKDTHYYVNAGASAGYEEVALRVYAALRGLSARAAVPAAQHPQETYSWDHWWGYRHSIGGAGPFFLSSWSDDIGTDSLGVENGAPTHVASDSGFGGRAVISFDGTSDRFTEPSIVAGAGNKWVFFWAMRVPAAGLAAARCVVQLEEATPSTGNRISCMILSGGALAIDLNGSGFTFTGAWPAEPDIEHTHLVDYDGGVGGGTAHLYVDGILQSTRTGIGNVSVASGGNARIRVGSFSGIAHFSGVIPFLAVKAAPAAVPTAAEAYALHVGARVELKLET